MAGIDPLTAGINLIGKFIHDPAEKLKAEESLRDDLSRANESQNAINLEQAKHDSLIVSAPRPALMWACVLGQMYAIGLQPIMQDMLISFYKDAAPILTTLDTASLNTITVSLFAIRSGEVHMGKARKALDLKDGFFARRRARKAAKQ